MNKLIIAAFVAALTGCATSSSGVAPLGDGRYMLHGSDLTGWGAPNEVKAAQGLIAIARNAGRAVQVVNLPVGHHQMTEAPDGTLMAIRDYLKTRSLDH